MVQIIHGVAHRGVRMKLIVSLVLTRLFSYICCGGLKLAYRESNPSQTI